MSFVSAVELQIYFCACDSTFKTKFRAKILDVGIILMNCLFYICIEKVKMFFNSQIEIGEGRETKSPTVYSSLVIRSFPLGSENCDGEGLHNFTLK
jgi:hypothetical protein